MDKLEEMRTGKATINDVPMVIFFFFFFFNFGAELQSAVGSTQDRRTDDKRTDYSKIKEFAHDYLKLDDNGGEFSKWVENTVGKRRNCAVRPNLLFRQCFQLFVP